MKKNLGEMRYGIKSNCYKNHITEVLKRIKNQNKTVLVKIIRKSEKIYYK